MRLIRPALLGLALLLAAAPAARAAPPADRLALLQRGVNLTHWFRYPVRADDASLRAYLGDAAMAGLRQAGFTFVRLAVQPELLDAEPGRQAVLLEAIARLQRHGLAVVVVPHPATWRLEDSAADRDRLLGFWRALAPALRRFDPRLTYPELLNEPVFAGTASAWESLQRAGLGVIRAALPDATVVLTGADWGGIDGLTALHPLPDGNVVYSFHFYEPSELTSLAAYRAGLDRDALARLPFPMTGAACAPAEQASGDAGTRALIAFTCGLHWDTARIAARIGQAADWATTNRAAVMMGEFGASRRLNGPARLGWLRAVRAACTRRGIGWALWGYDDPMGFGIDPHARAPADMDRATLDALGLRAPDTAR